MGLFLLFVFLVALINLFVSSMSAKWAILSTVFVPMLLIAGISPAATQMAYRVGDSLTNNITPTFAYLGIILTYAQKYDRRAQTGTVIAYMLPFSISFTIVWGRAADHLDPSGASDWPRVPRVFINII